MPEITRRGRIRNIMIFFIDERVFSKLENMGINIEGMNFCRWMVMVPFTSHLSIFDSMQTSRVKAGFLALVSEKV